MTLTVLNTAFTDEYISAKNSGNSNTIRGKKNSTKAEEGLPTSNFLPLDSQPRFR